jgi:hypothetical protein
MALDFGFERKLGTGHQADRDVRILDRRKAARQGIAEIGGDEAIADFRWP